MEEGPQPGAQGESQPSGVAGIVLLHGEPGLHQLMQLLADGMPFEPALGRDLRRRGAVFHREELEQLTPLGMPLLKDYRIRIQRWQGDESSKVSCFLLSRCGDVHPHHSRRDPAAADVAGVKAVLQEQAHGVVGALADAAVNVQRFVLRQFGESIAELG